MRVSIPFKRESVSKVKVHHLHFAPNGFQFPSNGKAYPKAFEYFTGGYGIDIVFNSLQTGKRIQSGGNDHTGDGPSTVSIPFKRESVSKDDNRKSFGTTTSVSIPFKRESVSKVLRVPTLRVRQAKSFNSLQTGKRIQRQT